MTEETPLPERPPRARAGKLLLSLSLALGLGIAIGTRWHATFERWLGAGAEEDETSTAEPEAPEAPPQLWTCGMHPQVIQDHPGQCPICHMALTPLEVEAPTKAAPSGERTIKYWWDPMMNPPYISDQPGKSPMGMDLVPVYEDEDEAVGASTITIDPTVVQNMGVKTAVVTQGPLLRSVRTVGYVEEAEPNVREINLLVSGWIRRLHADIEGMHVEKHDPLFDLYSPELHAAIEELIRLRHSARTSATAAGSTDGRAWLGDAAARRLELWGLTSGQIERLSKLDRAPRSVTFTSPIAGDVTEKNVVEGAAVDAGDAAMRIVDHSTVWIEAKVFEQDLAAVSLGQQVTASVRAWPGESFAGSVVFIHPHVDVDTRTVVVRFTVDNPGLRLRPGMYATVELRATLALAATLVPREALIDTGVRKLAFVAQGDGRFSPREVETGPSDGEGNVQVLAGLSPGEVVVTSGQFLLDSESRLREAVQKFLREREEAAQP